MNTSDHCNEIHLVANANTSTDINTVHVGGLGIDVYDHYFAYICYNTNRKLVTDNLFLLMYRYSQK